MSNHQRNRRYIRDDITRVLTVRLEVGLNPGQRFYETETTYELRDTRTDACVTRIRKDEVTSVVTKEL